MPSASAAARNSRSRSAGRAYSPRPRSTNRTGPSAPPVARVRWDRVGRTAILCVLVAIAYLYLSAGIRLLSAWGESKHDAAQVVALERQNRLLERQHQALGAPGAVQAQARRLGMTRPGEQAYVVRGLPAN